MRKLESADLGQVILSISQILACYWNQVSIICWSFKEMINLYNNTISAIWNLMNTTYLKFDILHQGFNNRLIHVKSDLIYPRICKRRGFFCQSFFDFFLWISFCQTKSHSDIVQPIRSKYICFSYFFVCVWK